MKNNLKKHLATAFIVLATCNGVFAAPYNKSNSATSKQKQIIPNCSGIDLKKTNLGTICLTSTGYQFKRVRADGILGIQDLNENGKVWFDAINHSYHIAEARSYCSNVEQSRPTKEDFVLAEAHGFREAFNDDMQGFFFSSSLAPSDHLGIPVRYIFDGERGRLMFSNHFSNNADSKMYSSRCVNY